MTVTAYGETIQCDRAEKGMDYVKLYLDDELIFHAQKVTDFTQFSISGGGWSAKPPSNSARLAAAEEAILGLMMGGISNV